MPKIKPQPLSEHVTVTLDVSPSWWGKVHHRKKGALIVALQQLQDYLDTKKVEPLEIHATMSTLTVTLRFYADERMHTFEELATGARQYLEDEIAIEDSDLRAKGSAERAASEPAEIEPTAEPEAPPPPPVTRAQVERRLRACGFVCADDQEHETPRPDDADIWVLPENASRCVQFDERTGPDDTGKALWMQAPDGEKLLPFLTIMARLAAFGEAPAKEPKTNVSTSVDLPPDMDGIFPGDGQAHGGIFAKEQHRG
jgi:hypothetical protein